MRWRVRMGVCYVEVFRANGLSSSGTQVGTLPDSALPSHSLYLAICARHENNTAQLWVGGTSDSGSKGQVWLYSNGESDAYGAASWPIELG